MFQKIQLNLTKINQKRQPETGGPFVAGPRPSLGRRTASSWKELGHLRVELVSKFWRCMEVFAFWVGEDMDLEMDGHEMT